MWCSALAPNLDTLDYIPNEREKLKTNYSNLNKDIVGEFDKKIINQLKYQISDLSKKLQESLNKTAEAEYRATRAESNKEMLEELSHKNLKELKESNEKIVNLENTIFNLNEALNIAKKEIIKLQNEVNKEIQSKESFNEMYNKTYQEKENNSNSLNSQINYLNIELNNLYIENENLKKNLSTKSVSQELFNTYQKNNEEKEKALITAEKNLKIFINENGELKRQLGEEENYKSKLNDILKKKKMKNSALKDEVGNYKTLVEQYMGEIKWNQDLVNQRDLQIKVLKDKIKKLDEEIAKHLKTNEKLTKNLEKKNYEINANYNDIDYEINQVKAKPFLFGPEN